jgi:hypothetical protein
VVAVVVGASAVAEAWVVQEELGVHAGAAGSVVEVEEVAAGSADCPEPQLPQLPQPPVGPAAQPPVWVTVMV